MAKILIVEDEESMLEILADHFTREGFDVLKAKNGEEGLKAAFKDHPDLILLDIIMPKMDGLTMLKKLRKDDRGKDIPVIMLSNLSGAGEVANAIQEGAFGYLIKTAWKIDDVVKRVKGELGM